MCGTFVQKLLSSMWVRRQMFHFDNLCIKYLTGQEFFKSNLISRLRENTLTNAYIQTKLSLV